MRPSVSSCGRCRSIRACSAHSNPEMSLKDNVSGLGLILLSFFIYLIGTGESLWESGNPAFGFPLFHGGRGRGCGNVGIAAAISKGSWVAMGNLVLVFLAVHSAAFPLPFLMSCCFPVCEAAKHLLLRCLHLGRGAHIAV